MYSDNSNSYWDYISSLGPAEVADTIKELFKENFHFLRPVLEELFWVDSNCVYLNLVCGVPQIKIAKMLGMSQLAVSKRIRTTLKKIKNILMRPEEDLIQVRRDFNMLLAVTLVETAVVYYQLKTFSVTSRVLNEVKEGAIRVRVYQMLSQLESLVNSQSLGEFLELVESRKPLYLWVVKSKIKEFPSEEDAFLYFRNLAKRYYDYFNLIINVGYYSDFVYKKFDERRVACKKNNCTQVAH